MFFWFMVFKATFNNISAISWGSVIGGGNRSTWTHNFSSDMHWLHR